MACFTGNPRIDNLPICMAITALSCNGSGIIHKYVFDMKGEKN